MSKRMKDAQQQRMLNEMRESYEQPQKSKNTKKMDMDSMPPAILFTLFAILAVALATFSAIVMALAAGV